MEEKRKITLCEILLALPTLALAFFIFARFTPENFLQKSEVISVSDIEADKVTDFTGKQAGSDILRLSGKQEWEDLLSIDYVCAQPDDIVETGVYHLNAWSDPYNKKKIGKKVIKDSKKALITQSGFDIMQDYSQYYLIRLPDNSYILSLMPERYKKAIERGEKVTLPLGKKQALLNTAASHLTQICNRYDASMDGVLYTLDDNWYRSNRLLLFSLRFGASAVVFFVTSFLLFSFSFKFLKKRKKEE